MMPVEIEQLELKIAQYDKLSDHHKSSELNKVFKKVKLQNV